VGAALACIPQQARPTRLAGMGGDVRGRELYAREKRGDAVGTTKRGKGTKCMVVVDGEGIPIGATIHSASPAESKLIETTLDSISRPKRGRGRLTVRIKRLIADKAYDCDMLRVRMAERGINLICPHRRNRTAMTLQDGRELRRYKRRWKVERTFAWLQNFRRLVTRYERKSTMFLAFVHVACALITLRAL
jgi:transposase